MLMVFLLIINFVISILLFINMYHEQKAELIEIARQEINELKLDPNGYFNDKHTNTNLNKIKGIFLTYFIKNDNKLEVIDDFSPELHTSIMKKIGNWKPDKISVKYVEVNFPKNHPIYLFVVSQNVYINGQRLGTIYIGKDIKLLRVMLIHFLFILIGLSLVFFIISFVVGQIMTKRAMKPIIKAYSLQSEFIADASHELRTPLSVLKSGLDVIEFEEKNKLSSFSENVLSDLKEEINRTTQLVNNMLFLIRSDSGQQSLFITFDLFGLMQQIIRSFKPLSESKLIDLDLLTAGPLRVYTDREKVQQILYILMDNAIKYTPSEGKVSIWYGLKPANQKKKLVIIVRDNGVGIPIEEQERIFDRFYRVDKSRSRENGSSGLGLSIGKSLAESLNGSIEVTSTLNKGSEFALILPLLKGQ